MFRILGAGLLALALSGCATPGDRAWWRSFAGLQAEPAQFHFDWQISGDPSLAPLQAFDDGESVWLQYPAGQAVPALFEQVAAGERLLHPVREGDYLIVRRVPPRILLRGGHLQAVVRRSSSAVDDATAGSVGAASPAAAAARPAAIAAPLPPVAVPVAPPLIAAPAVEPPAVRPKPRQPVVRATPAPAAAIPAPAAFRFDVTPADENLRRALGRWARHAGWTFEAEHWSVDVDIPLAGSAAFGTTFVPAVRELLAATELGERPLQPCFYANQVLRVVPLAQRCDRTRASADAPTEAAR